MAGRYEGPCEMAVGWEMNGNPRIRYCGKPGIERPDMPCIVAHPIACGECHDNWKVRRDRTV